MEELRVCFIGYGSIAKRHISNLRRLFSDRERALVIDILRHEKSSVVDRNIDNIKYNKLDKKSLYDIIFITNPTSMHYQTIKKYYDNAKMLFVEKPLVSYRDINKIKKLRLNSNRIYVACPLRYKKIIQYIKNNIDLKSVICVRAICSSYLPEWRKGIDYTKSYSANAKLGGGVRLDLIHEWDYIKYLFGKPKNIIYKYNKFSDLKIDTEDIATYIAEYNNKFVELHIDYFGRTSQRKLEIYLNDEVITADLLKNIIYFSKADKKLKFHEERNDYQIAELAYFIDLYNNNVKNENNLIKSIDTINLTRGKV